MSMDDARRWVSLTVAMKEADAGAVSSSIPGSSSVSIATAKGQLELRAATKVARWEGAELHLGFEPRARNSELLIHELDLRKNVLPLLESPELPPASNRVVVIDAGHGGREGGTRSVLDGSPEKDFALDWALRLADLMRSNSWQVVLTRTNDLELTLSNRVAIANAVNADLFISLHFNSAAPSQHQRGLETYCLTPTGMRSTLVREFEDNPAAAFPNNEFDAANLRYAMLLHRALLKECGFVDRGVRRARFMGVLRGHHRPAVLLEAGFLSNPQDAARIQTPEFRQSLAEAVARALM